MREKQVAQISLELYAIAVEAEKSDTPDKDQYCDDCVTLLQTKLNTNDNSTQITVELKEIKEELNDIWKLAEQNNLAKRGKDAFKRVRNNARISEDYAAELVEDIPSEDTHWTPFDGDDGFDPAALRSFMPLITTSYAIAKRIGSDIKSCIDQRGYRYDSVQMQ